MRPALTACLLLLSLPCAAQAPSEPPRTVLVLPFENASGVPGIAWIGESFPEVVGRGLDASARFVIAREERLYALERLGIPGGARLTRATLFRIGEAMDLDYLVLGSYEFDGRVFTARAQVLEMRSLRLSAEAEQSGPLPDLMEIQSALAWNLLGMMEPRPAVNREQFLKDFPRVRLDALENHIRGVLAAQPQDRLRHLREAVRLQPDYAQARLQLGKALLEARDYTAAAAAFARIPPQHPALGRAAQFHLGLAAYYLGDFARAAAAFGALASSLPLAEASNNLGVVAARRGEAAAAGHFRRAAEVDPGDADYRFNLAVALYRGGELQSAARELREAVSLQPGDGEAAALLGALEGTGPAPVPAPLERIRRSYDEAVFRQLAMERRRAQE